MLLKRTQVMFMHGKGRLMASGDTVLITVLTQRILLDASEVITSFDVQRPEVQEACGQKLDAREALAFLLGDVMLGARIPNEYARKLGDRLGKLVFGSAASLPKERTALGRAHDKRKGRLSKLNPGYELKLLALTGQISDSASATLSRVRPSRSICRPSRNAMPLLLHRRQSLQPCHYLQLTHCRHRAP